MNETTMPSFLPLLCCLCVGFAHADALFIHEEPNQAGECYLSNAQGQRLFQGEYMTACSAMGSSQFSHTPDGSDTDNAYQTVHLLRFRGQEYAVINVHGDTIYHSYWFDNGPDYIEDGLFRMRNQQGLIGFADGATGAIGIQPQYACAFPFANGVAEVAVYGKVVQKAGAEHRVCVGDYFKIDHQGQRLD